MGRFLFVVSMVLISSGAAVAAGPFASPESIVVSGGFMYVSNVGEKLDPTTKDGDGYITRLTAKGGIKEKKFIEGLDAPKGLIVVNNILYVADIDKVLGFDAATGEKKYEIDFSGEKTSFLNGFAARDGAILYVSATDIGKIFEIKLGPVPSFRTLADGMAGPNGLAYVPGNNTLYVVCWGTDGKPNGPIGAIDLAQRNPSFKRIGKYQGYLDGVLYANKTLIFSDWVSFEKAGTIKMIQVDIGSVAEVKLEEPIGGPADFTRDPTTGDLLIPAMIDGTILFVPWPINF
jgi:hypothetical protein